ncbi:MAG: hypothetical protein IRZ07_25305 [Microbispora sp.]|nr:hypothetical protein [Microbispora sp.]
MMIGRFTRKDPVAPASGLVAPPEEAAVGPKPALGGAPAGPPYAYE